MVLWPGGSLCFIGELSGDSHSRLCVVFLCVCTSVLQTCCHPTVCVSASRNAANEREEGACRGQEQGQNNTGCQESVRECVHVCLTIPLTSFCWEPESENACVHETSQASLLIGRNKCVSVCVCILSVTMPPPHTHTFRTNRKLRLEGSSSSRADVSELSRATIKNKQEVVGHCEGPMRSEQTRMF